MRAFIPFLMSAVSIALGDAARPCSVVPEYLRPTVFELVATSDVIALTEVLGAASSGDRDHAVDHRVLRVVKGTGVAPGDLVRTGGVVVAGIEVGKRDDFSRARPGAHRGGCVAFDYAPKKRYLLFLDRVDGELEMVGTPFSRVNEEVTGDDDPWLLAVIEYAKIAALGDRAAQRKALQALGRERSGGIAADVADHFARPTRDKRFDELLPLYRSEDPLIQAQAFVAIGTGGDPAARAFMRARLDEIGRGESSHPPRAALLAISKYYEQVDDDEALREAAALYVDLGSARTRRPAGR